jgi:FkbM family methyltransferase
MFINLEELKNKYTMNIKGIIHVGAHLLEELETYKNLNINNITWIEANDEIVQKAKINHPEQTILNYTVYDLDNIELEFNVATNGQSSSILNFGTHSSLYPSITFYEKKLVKTKTLKTIIDQNNIDLVNYNMLNLDIQGVELKAIKGFGDYISHIDYIYTEVNEDSVYENNDLMKDIDDYLLLKGFLRKETCLINGNWGDALYIKQ